MVNINTARNLLRLMTAASVLSAHGCLLAIPVAIFYYQRTRDYVATAEVDAPADRVHPTAIKETQAR